MEKNYTEIDSLGKKIDIVVQELIEYPIKNNGSLAFCNFNGKTFFSDTVSLDSAYLELTKKSYSQFHNDRNTIERRQVEYRASIPERTAAWIENGHKILSEDKWERWDEIVPVRLDNIYQGIELGYCLSLVDMINKGRSFSEVKLEIESQPHSSMSFDTTCAMRVEFSDKG